MHRKLLRRRKRVYDTFLEPSEKPKFIHIDNWLEFGKSCEALSWNHCTSAPHRSETNGIADIAKRSINEGTSAVLFAIRLGVKNGKLILWNAVAVCEVFKTSWQMGEHLMNGDLENHIERPIIPL